MYCEGLCKVEKYTIILLSTQENNNIFPYTFHEYQKHNLLSAS